MSKAPKRPCDGKNSNVCVAEGCYGEACLETTFEETSSVCVIEGCYGQREDCAYSRYNPMIGRYIHNQKEKEND